MTLLVGQESSADGERIGSAVLVHGGWGWPDDWHWVRDLLTAAGVEVSAPDLPTHRATSARIADDTAEVRAAIRASRPPVIVAGWSYGGDVASLAVAGEPTVVRLVLVSAIPRHPGFGQRDDAWVENDPHLLVGSGGSFGLDNDWWFAAEAERLFTGDVLDHFRRHPRRAVSRATATDPLPVAGWQTVPTTLIMGTQDDFLGPADRAWINSFADVHWVEADHFVPFTRPEVVATCVLEALTAAAEKIGEEPSS